MNEPVNRTPFEILAQYERLSLAHASDTQEKFEAPGLWRGIGFRVGSRLLVSGIDEINELLAVPVLTPVPGTQPWLLGVANVPGSVLGTRGALRHGAGFVRVVFIVVVSALILKTAYDAFLK